MSTETFIITKRDGGCESFSIETIKRAIFKATQAAGGEFTTSRLFAGIGGLAVCETIEALFDFHCGSDFLRYYRELQEELHAARALKGELVAMAEEYNRHNISVQEIVTYNGGEQPYCATSTNSVPPNSESAAQRARLQNEIDRTSTTILYLEHELDILDRMKTLPSLAAKMLNIYKDTQSNKCMQYAEHLLEVELKRFEGDALEDEIIRRLTPNPIYKLYEQCGDDDEAFASAIINDEQCSDKDLTMYWVFQKVLEISGCLVKPLKWLKRKFVNVKDNIKCFVTSAYNKYQLDKVSANKAAARIYHWLNNHQFVERCNWRIESFATFFHEATNADVKVKTLQNAVSETKNCDTSELDVVASFFGLSTKVA